MLPTDEELKTLRTYRSKNRGDVSRLMPAEQVFRWLAPGLHLVGAVIARRRVAAHARRAGSELGNQDRFAAGLQPVYTWLRPWLRLVPGIADPGGLASEGVRTQALQGHLCRTQAIREGLRRN